MLQKHPSQRGQAGTCGGGSGMHVMALRTPFAFLPHASCLLPPLAINISLTCAKPIKLPTSFRVTSNLGRPLSPGSWLLLFLCPPGTLFQSIQVAQGRGMGGLHAAYGGGIRIGICVCVSVLYF